MDRFNQPRVIGEVLLGIVLGPSLIGLISLSDPSTILSYILPLSHSDIDIAAEIIAFMAEVGVLFLLFEVGMEIEFDVLRRVGKVAAGAAVGGILTPFMAGLAFVAGGILIFSPEILVPVQSDIFQTGLFFGAALTATSVGISIRVFIEMNQLNTRVARTVVGAAVIDDIISIMLLTLAITYTDEANAVGLKTVLLILFQIIGFFLVVILIYKYLFPLFLKSTRSSKDRYLPLMTSLALMFFLASFASEMKLAAIIGSFMAGLIINTDREFVSQVKAQFSPLAHWITPFFFLSVGLKVNAGALISPVVIILSAIITLIAILSKLIGGIIGTHYTHFSWQESKIVGMAMAARGEVTLIFSFEALKLGFFTQELFAATILSVILNAIIVPGLLSRMSKSSDSEILYDGTE